MENNLQELQELLAFGKALKDGIVETKKGKKARWLALLNFTGVPKTVRPAFQNLGNPVERFKELTHEERIQLRISVYKELESMTPDEIDALIEETLLAAHNLIVVAKKWGNLKKAA